MLEVVTVVTWVGIIGVKVDLWQIVAFLWWSTGMIILAFIDAKVLRLPFRIIITTTVGTLIFLIPTGAPISVWWAMFAATAILTVFYVIIRMMSRGNLGLGDVALSVPLGIGVGWHQGSLLVVAIVLAHTLAAVTIGIRRFQRRKPAPLPLGTYLAIASITVIIVYCVK